EGHEAAADRVDHRIDQIADVPPLQGLDAAVERVEPFAEIRDDYHTRVATAELPRHFQVGAVDAEDQLRSSFHRAQDLRGVEAVHADPHARLAQLAHHVAQLGEGHSGGTADIDEIRPVGREV